MISICNRVVKNCGMKFTRKCNCGKTLCILSNLMKFLCLKLSEDKNITFACDILNEGAYAIALHKKIFYLRVYFSL